jgi:formate dehydrogenase accessory protein FdhE
LVQEARSRRLEVKGARGGPGDWERRLERAEAIPRTPAIAHQMELLVAVLRHQAARAEVLAEAAAAIRSEAVARRLTGRFPLLDLEGAVEPVAAEVVPAVAALAGSAPRPLGAAGEELAARPLEEVRALVAAWLDDPSLVEERLEFWIRVAGAPLLELACTGGADLSRAEWSGAACPACGGPPQTGVIGERSGEFMGGSPRYLVCSRCALWWGYPRATCVACGEDNSTRLHSFSEQQRSWVRVDVCDTCRGYVKTFDLREPGGGDVVPLVDDIATLALDLWAHEQGCARASLSLAGV